MKAHLDFTINGRRYRRGEDFPWYFVYPFFLVHMLAFGLSGFFMAYGSDSPDLVFLYLHGGFAITVYIVFYVVLFGVDQVRWMFINAGLGLFGIYAQIDWILELFGKQADDFSAAVHVIPFLYYMLYTFLLYQLVLELSGAHRHPERRPVAEAVYVVASALVYGVIYLV